MKLFFSILLFTTFAIRPLIEISNVLYYQLNIDTIIEKYCVNKERPSLNCNGKCYLMNQMKVNTPSNDTNSNALTVIIEAFIPLFYEDTAIEVYTNPCFLSKHQKNWGSTQLRLYILSENIDHPPEIHFT